MNMNHRRIQIDIEALDGEISHEAFAELVATVRRTVSKRLLGVMGRVEMTIVDGGAPIQRETIA